VLLGNIALVLEGLGQYEEAIQTYQEANTFEERALGPDHPRVAIGHGNLASLLIRLNHPEEALVHARRALAIEQKNPASEPGDLGASYLTVSAALYHLGRYEEALEHNQQARKLLTGTVGAKHPWTVEAEDIHERILAVLGGPTKPAAPGRRGR
jgi:tetratricopeptide (TPR) repeat protein